MDFFCCIALWLFSFLLYELNKEYWRMCKRACLRVSSNCFYVDLVFQVFRMRIALFYILPSITRFFFYWENDYIEHVDPCEIVVVYLFELISHFIYYLTFYTLLKRNSHNLSLVYDNNIVLNIIAVLCLVIYCFFSITGYISSIRPDWN